MRWKVVLYHIELLECVCFDRNLLIVYIILLQPIESYRVSYSY